MQKGGLLEAILSLAINFFLLICFLMTNYFFLGICFFLIALIIFSVGMKKVREVNGES